MFIWTLNFMDLRETNKECYVSVKNEPLYNYAYNLWLIWSKYTLVIEIKSYKTNLYTWYTILPQIPTRLVFLFKASIVDTSVKSMICKINNSAYS
jgi:hypothetical protein